MSKPYEITASGNLLEIHETTERTGKGRTYREREFVLEKRKPTKGGKDWVEPIKFRLEGDNCDKLDNFNVGQEVEVRADVCGFAYNGKTYVNLKAWSITHAGADGERREVKPMRNTQPRNGGRPYPDDREDDIPF